MVENIIKKYDFIDIGKFIASFGVAVAHVIQPDNMILYQLCQVGLMAYFFFASGFTFKEDIRNIKIIDKIIKNIKTLLIPYFIVSIIGILFSYIFPGYYGDITWKDRLDMIFIVGYPYYFGLAWFLICLFWVNNIFFILWKVIGNKKNNIFVLIIILICLYYLNIYLINNPNYLNLPTACEPPKFYIPLKLDVAITGLIFFILGFISRKCKLYVIFDDKLWNYILSIILIIVTGIAKYVIETKYLGYSNMTAMLYGSSYFLYLIEQMIGIIHFLSIACILQKCKFLAKWGSLNLWLYLIHTNILWFFEWVYCVIILNIDIKYAYKDLLSILLLSIPTYFVSLLIAYFIDNIKKGKIFNFQFEKFIKK